MSNQPQGVGLLSSGRLLSVRRLLLSMAAGLAAGATAVVLGVPELSAVLCWIVAAGLVLFWVWRISWPQDPDGTEQLAEAERRSRPTDAAVLIASGVSLAVVAEALIRFSGRQDATAVPPSSPPSSRSSCPGGWSTRCSR